MLLEIDSLGKTYGERNHSTAAIGDLSFSVSEREFVCVVGPSGCGKTTLLKCMSGLMPPTRGEVRLWGKKVTGPPDDLALVFQDYSRSLFPWLTVAENIMLPLRRKGLSKGERRDIMEHSAASVGLLRAIGRYPWQLSGGMQQRVAIARAIAYQPKILLMDEPFASVDAQTRSDLEDLVLRVREEYDLTVVFVTHDIGESVYLGDRIVVLMPAPTSVQEVLTVDLPQPRDQVETKSLPEFVNLSAHIYRAIKQTVKMEPVPPH